MCLTRIPFYCSALARHAVLGGEGRYQIDGFPSGPDRPEGARRTGPRHSGQCVPVHPREGRYQAWHRLHFSSRWPPYVGQRFECESG